MTVDSDVSSLIAAAQLYPLETYNFPNDFQPRAKSMTHYSLLGTRYFSLATRCFQLGLCQLT